MKLIDRDQLNDCLVRTDISNIGLLTDATLTISNFPTTLTCNGTYYNEPERKISFSCPYCGTHYLARDPGFVPNCHNCGAIMRKE